MSRRRLCRGAWAAAILGASLLAGALQAQPSTHVVRPGDTLWGISGQHYRQAARWPELQRLNHVGEPRRLQPGTVLYFADGRPLGSDEAMVLAVTGQAWRRRPGRPDAPLAQGDPVRAGDTLVTTIGAFLTLGLPDGSRSVIPSNSAVEVQAVERQRIGFRLLEGGIESQVIRQQPAQQFDIRTRTVVLSVRGTHFRVHDRDGQVSSEVLQGQVAVHDLRHAGDRPALLLDAGQGAVLTDAMGLTARSLLPAPRFGSRALSPAAPAVDIDAVSGAQGYAWRIAQDDLFLAPLAEGVDTHPTLALPAGLAPGFYYLRVAALDAQRLEGTPADLLFYMPASAGTVQWQPDGRVVLRWAGSSARYYRLELSRDAGFTVPVLDMQGLQASGATVGPFAVGGRYHWRVSESADGTHYEEPFTGGSLDAPER